MRGFQHRFPRRRLSGSWGASAFSPSLDGASLLLDWRKGRRATLSSPVPAATELLLSRAPKHTHFLEATGRRLSFPPFLAIRWAQHSGNLSGSCVTAAAAFQLLHGLK